MSRCLLVWCLVLAGVARPLTAQTDSLPPWGSIAGVVRDSSGHPVAQARVRVSTTKGWVLTDSTGHYRLDSIPVGEARVIARRVGYMALRRDSVVIRAGEVTSLDLSFRAPYCWEISDTPLPYGLDSGAKGLYAVPDSSPLANLQAFSLSFFRTVAKSVPDSNVLISPVGAAIMLGMVYAGAERSTATTFARSVGLDTVSAQRAGKRTVALLGTLYVQCGANLKMASSLSVRSGRPILPSYVDAVRQWFGAGVTTRGLRGADAKQAKNDGFANAAPMVTPFPHDTLPDSAAMVLLNAIGFTGTWHGTFDAKGTTPEPFHRSDGRLVTRRLMSRRDSLMYYRGDRFQAVRLPYEGGRVAMYVFLPDSGVSLGDFLAQLDATNWNQWMHAFQIHAVLLRLPRFEVQDDWSFVEPLTTLGMGAAFTPGTAAFRRMLAPSFFADSNAYLSDLQQTTAVSVGEYGTVAVRDSGAVVATVPAVVPPISFVVDRPFVFLIRDERTGVLLLGGQIADP